MSPEQDLFLERLYHEQFKYLTAYAYHFVDDWEKAEVVVQEAFCIAIEKIDAVMSSDAPLRWMKATVKNTARNMKKHENYQRALFLHLEELEAFPSAPDALNAMGMEEFCEQITGPESFRLFKHIALDGISYMEAAKELDIGVWACRKRVQRTVETLRDALKEYF